MHTLTTSFFQSSLSLWLRRHAPGLLLSTALALAAMGLAQWPWMAAHGMGALTLALVLGLLIGNTVYPRMAAQCTPGVNIGKQQLLRSRHCAVWPAADLPRHRPSGLKRRGARCAGASQHLWLGLRARHQAV